MTEDGRDILVFDLDGAAYGVDALMVRETQWLPELSPAPRAAGILGRFDLRGEIVPVLDLSPLLGHPLHRCLASDQVMILAAEGSSLGIVVSQVRDLVRLPPDAFLPLSGLPAGGADALAVGGFQLGEGLATLLDARSLVRRGSPAGASEPAREQEPVQGATPAEQALLRQRARALRQPAVARQAGRQLLAAVELGGQCFGIDLRAVQEFCRVPALSLVPCCPPHVAGVFSLRGHFVTLLEIASAFGLPPPSAPRPQAVIGRLGEAAVGIGIDAVLDVFSPAAGELAPLPAAFSLRRGPELLGGVPFAGRTVAVLDLPGLLALEAWVVDERNA